MSDLPKKKAAKKGDVGTSPKKKSAAKKKDKVNDARDGVATAPDTRQPPNRPMSTKKIVTTSKNSSPRPPASLAQSSKRRATVTGDVINSTQAPPPPSPQHSSPLLGQPGGPGAKVNSRKLSQDTASTRRSSIASGSASSNKCATPRPPPGVASSNLSAPCRPKSLQTLPSGSLPKPTSRRMESSRTMGSSHTGGGKPLGKNAISNRNLPPPPGSRSIFNKSSSHHKRTSSHHKKNNSYRPSFSTDDDDDDLDDSDDEFGQDVAPDYQNKSNQTSILRKSNLRASGAKRINADGSITVGLNNTHTMNSVDENEELGDDRDVEMAPLSGRRVPKSGMQKPGWELSASEHSMRGWTQSFRWGSKPPANASSAGVDRREALSGEYSNKNQSVRSVLTADVEYEEEPLWKQTLRYIRILPPHQDEKPVKKYIRILTWLSLVLDFSTGLVSIVQFQGVTYCCGKPILSIAGDINWSVGIQITVYLYMALIFIQVAPVVREIFPFNLFNPFVGFLITFAMFFDDRMEIAIAMWVIEFLTVVCALIIYRLKVKWHEHRGARLKQTEQELLAIRKERKRRKLSNSTHSDNSDITMDDASFHDESEISNPSYTPPGAEVRPVDISQIRETRLLRERRMLRQAQKEDRVSLRYHFVGVTFNVGLVVCSLLLITMIGRSGGLCIVDMVSPNIFKKDQLEMCFECRGFVGDKCEVCAEDGSSHCYYPYY